MLAISDLARLAERCRIVNRAFGTSLTPDQIADMLPDEQIDLLLALDAAEQLGETQTLLRRLLLK